MGGLLLVFRCLFGPASDFLPLRVVESLRQPKILALSFVWSLICFPFVLFYSFISFDLVGGSSLCIPFSGKMCLLGPDRRLMLRLAIHLFLFGRLVLFVLVLIYLSG